MSSAANAPLSNIRERKQGKLLSYFPAPQRLCGARSCGKRARKGHFVHLHLFEILLTEGLDVEFGLPVVELQTDSS
jgi:hypothetical protein